ncbi:MAG: hypothetical protein ACYTAF_09790 [Planctomycetota bacterium]
MRRTLILATLSVLFCASLAGAGVRQGTNWTVNLQSKHYDLYSNATREQAQELLDHMELVFATYVKLMKPKNPSALDRQRFRMELHKDKDDYVRGGGPEGSGAYYRSSPNKKLVGYWNSITMKVYMAHEGMHQFHDMTCANFQSFAFWFQEGIADCIGNHIVKDKKLYMCSMKGVIARGRLATIKKAIGGKKQYSLRKLVMMGRQEFMANAGLCYAQAWSFTHFLMTFPKAEEAGRQIPDGKYRKYLGRYFDVQRGGAVDPEQAWKRSFGKIKPEDLEEDWINYVCWTLDAGRVMGIDGEGITEEAAKGLGLADGTGGIELTKVTEEYAASRAGLEVGDILAKVSGRDIVMGKELETLREILQEIPQGGETDAVIYRDGNQEEVKISWAFEIEGFPPQKERKGRGGFKKKKKKKK